MDGWVGGSDGWMDVGSSLCVKSRSFSSPSSYGTWTGWIDGWMEGWLDEWMDGRDGWVDGWMDRWVGGRLVGGWMDG
jgi:hypothetical protein